METKYHPTIGLEIHAELATRTKMFCDSKNDSDEKEPNVNICPICMGHPGTLPVINKEAVKHVLKVGVAVGGELADFTEFDRKNYFYPDIPKGYQISQYKYPLVKGGRINGVELTRIHLEEDTATSKHDQGDFSLVDFNRAGVPLMELVTEPVIKSAEEASAFAKELQLLLQYLGVAKANMEKGEMRVEANISISTDPKSFGTKVEVKNLNSFRSAERAIAFEIDRMTDLLEKGEKIIQETRGWDESKQKTFSQREKEESHDYRYFPDPDLPKLYISEIPEFKSEILKKEIPELPWEKRERYIKNGISAETTEFFVRNLDWGKVIGQSIEKERSSDLIKLNANFISSVLASGTYQIDLNNPSKTEDNVNGLMELQMRKEISSTGAKKIAFTLFPSGGDPREIAEREGLLQKHDEDELKQIVEKAIAQNPHVVADYKGGKQSALQFFIGQIMKETKGAANPEKVREILSSLLSK